MSMLRAFRRALTAKYFVAAVVLFNVLFIVIASWLSDAILQTTIGDVFDDAVDALPSISVGGRCYRDYSDNIRHESAEGYLCSEPIDAVYTWVNGSEEQHLRDVKFWQLRARPDEEDGVPASPTPPLHHGNVSRHHHASSAAPSPTLDSMQLEEQSSVSRFQDHDELMYSLRSLERFAPWVRRVYIVTNGQVPTWLNMDNPKIKVVSHSQIFNDKSHLPTFSSPAIESHLHRIPGLSRRFLYLNDDTFFGAPVVPDDFYSPTRGHRIYLSWPVPNCAQGCPATWLKDGFCDRACNTTDCDYDGGDCLGDAGKGPSNKASAHTINVNGVKVGVRELPPHSPNAPLLCAPGCSDTFLGDQRCDTPCDTSDCGFDGGDCDLASLRTLYSLNVTRRRHHALSLRLPPQTKAFTVNVSEWFPKAIDSVITSGEFDDHCWVRSATIIQTHKLLVITVTNVLRKEEVLKARLRDVCGFTLRGHGKLSSSSKSDEKIDIVMSFNVTLPVDRSTLSPKNVTHRITTQPAVSTQTSPSPSTANEEKTSATAADELALKAQDIMSRNVEIAKVQAAQQQIGNHRRLLSIDGHESEFVERQARQKEIDLENDELRHANDWRRALKDSVRASPDGHLHAAATQRHLLDMFGDSLKFGNKLLAARYGNAARKVPSHMVHLIDRDVVQRLWDLWPQEFAATSASKFRSKRNMQYGFFHFYYIMHAQREWTSDSIFDEVVDINQNGLIDDAEIRRIALIMFEKGFRDRTLRNALEEGTRNASRILGISMTLERSDDTATDGDTTGKTTGRAVLQVPPSSVKNMPPSEVVLTTTMERTETLVRPAAARGMSTMMLNRRNASGTPRATPTPQPAAVTPAPAPTFAPVTVPNPDDRIEPLPQSMVDLVRDLVEQGAFGIERRAIDHLTATKRSGGSGNRQRRMSRELFKDTALATLLMEKVTMGEYPYSLESENDVTFFMIRDNVTVVQHQMDHVLYKRNKFVCINDNMNHSHPDHAKVLDVLHTLFDAYYPEPSSFELEDHERNSFTRMTDEMLDEFYSSHDSRHWSTERKARFLSEPLGTIGYTKEEHARRNLGQAAQDARRASWMALGAIVVLCCLIAWTCVALRQRAFPRAE